ncbi:MAG: glycosyltransferase, partial [Waterburya sp.]
MKALVISPQPFFTCRGTPLSVYYRTLITTELGVSVDLLTYGEGEDVDIAGVNIIRIPRFKFLGPVKVGPSGLKLFLDIFIFFKAISLLIKNRYTFVHAHEEAVFFCWFLKPIFKFKLVYDMHSSLPEQLTNFEFTRSKLLIGLFGWLERQCLKVADVTITICPSLYNYARSLAPPQSFVTLIENSIFDEVNFAQPVLSGRKLDNFFADKRLVLYAGTLERYQGIDLLIAGCKTVMEKEPDLFLLIIGGTPAQVEHYTKLAKKCGISQRCQFMGKVAPQLAKYYGSLATVQVSARTSGTNTPLKIYEQISRGIPLVATNIASHTQVLDENVAFLVEPTPEGIARGIAAAIAPASEPKRKAA